MVKVDEFILPADFIVLNMKESFMPLPLPIILGISFMRTADTKIYVKKGIVSMKVNSEKIEFKIFDALKLPQDDLKCFNVFMSQGVVEKVFQVYHIDPLEATLTHSFTRSDIEPESEDVTDDIIEAMHLLEASPKHPSKYTTQSEILVFTNTTRVLSIVQASNLKKKKKDNM